MSLEIFYRDYKPQKTLRILVYPNITYAKDLEKDSYIQVIYSMITELNKIRNDLFFYLIMPKHMPMFSEFENTHSELSSKYEDAF